MITKTKDEISKLIKASKLADECYKYIITKIKPGMTEKRVAKLMDEYMLSHGATGLAFETIVGSGPNSSMIHSTPSTRKIRHGDVVQLDFGCVVDGYCSDCSRVLFIGEVKPEYKKIYNIVLKAQKEGIKNTKVGMTCEEVDAISRDIIKAKGYNFKHAVGHGVGKVVHDEPTISPKNTKDKMKNNVVFTIEPGIYIEGKFGIRIEDTCVMQNGVVKTLNKTSKSIKII
jgi:Xaa-Pro aminopeptidase